MTDFSDQDFIEGRCHAVRDVGLHVYLGKDVPFEDVPLLPNDSYRGIVRSDECILLWPEGDPPSWPLSFDAPDPRLVPWPTADPEDLVDADTDVDADPDATATRTDPDEPEIESNTNR